MVKDLFERKAIVAASSCAVTSVTAATFSELGLQNHYTLWRLAKNSLGF